MNRKPIIAISLFTITISGFWGLLNFSEWYNIAILDNTENYPFGGEGPVPYFYKTAELYSLINFTWFIIFFTVMFSAIIALYKGNLKMSVFLSIACLFLIAGLIIQGQIGN